MADRFDVALPAPGSTGPMPVSVTGDVVLTTGIDSLTRWAERALVCQQGGLHHRPAFGAGAERSLGRSALAERALLQSRYRRTLKVDDRIDDARVTVAASQDAPGRVVVSAQIDTVDGRLAQLSREV